MKESNSRIAVLILGYNDKQNLGDSIGSALKQTYDNYEVIYIDNGSSDGSAAFVKKSFPAIRTIANRNNLGYAGAYGPAVRNFFQEKFDACVLLNPDVIVDEAWLAELAKSAFSGKDIALVQPKIFLFDEKKSDLANSFGNEINFLGFGFCGHYKKRDSDRFKNDREITYASGASLLLKKDTYEAVGGLDEDFFSYLEDQDLGWRAKMQGFRVVLSARSKIWHKYKFHRNERNRLKFFYLERNRLYFLYKNFELKTLALVFPAFLMMEAGIVLNSISRGYFRDKIGSYYHFFHNIRELRKKRLKIQKNRTRKDSELFLQLSPAIEFEEIDSPFLRLANIFLRVYCRIVKFLI